MTDLPFGLESKSTFAALSPSDLQSLAKRASVAYLMGGTSLNDAIIKLAREFPSISPHQVQRVVEFANQETFAKLFSDNEKYASDKNIEFDVADPGVVLMELNNGARPVVMSVPPDEYSSGPVKLGHSNVEADIELARVFGMDPALPGSESTVFAKVAQDGTVVLDCILQTKEANANGDIFDRILSVGKTKQANFVSGVATQPTAMPTQAAAPAQGAPTSDEDNGATHNDQMLDLQREIELAKKRQELQKVEQQTLDSMNPQGQPGAVPAPAPGMPGQGPDAGAAGAPEQQQAAGPVEAAPMQQEQQAQMPEPAAGAITAPPGGDVTKMGSLMKQAMVHVKSGRPHSDLLVKAAESSVSLAMIKKATAHRGEYPHANPYGTVIRAKQKIAKLLEDCSYARGKNNELHKEATVRFQKAVASHLWSGGNLGEVAHLMSAVHGEPVSIKTAMTSAMQELVRQGIDITKAKAAAIQYEMEKSASVRTPNLKHPIAEAYSDLHKLAEGSAVLDEAWARLNEQHTLVEKALQEAVVHAPSI